MKAIFLGALITGTLFSTHAVAQKPKAATKTAVAMPQKVISIEGINEYKLPNGLKILMVPDATQNNVVVNVVYQVGSRHEGYGETGMAHLLEHMLFKGSKKFSSIKKTIADKGASANGTTWYDRTNYYEILPASDSNLRWALDMESDRMINSLMLKSDLDKEFSVVRNEFESGENNPNSILMERIFSTMYLWHNYGKSTIGSKEDIEKVPIENLKTFYKKYYQPDNATLIVGGKFDEQKTLRWIAEFFSPIPKPSRTLQPEYTQEPAQDGERFVELKRNGDIQYLGVGYHTPSFSDADYVANDAVIEILTNDPSGILYKALIETKLATKVWGYQQQLHDPGFTYFNVDVPKDKSIDSAKQVLLQTLSNLKNITLTTEQVDRAKNTLLKGLSDLQNNTINFCVSLTEIIGSGDWRLFYLYRDRLEKLTLEQVQAAAKKYYLNSNRTWGWFIPDKNPERVEVAHAPEYASLLKNYVGKKVETNTETFEASIANIKKQIKYATASNGLRYAVLTKATKGNKITAKLTFKMGTEKSLMNKSMIGELTARMLKNGTTTKSKKEINDALDKIKSTVNIDGSATEVQVNISTDKENLQAALAITEDILLHPSLDKQEFEKMILDVKGEYEANQSDPFVVGQKALEEKTNFYPKGHPYAHESIAEMIAELGTITLNDLKQFYQEFYGANNGFASFVGPINEAQAAQFINNALANFNSKAPYQRIPEQHFANKAGTTIAAIKDKQNAVLLAGLNIPIKQSNPDFAALTIANEILGGGAFLSSRIAQRLRESEGMSYGAGSFISIPYNDEAGSWGAYAIFNPSFKNKLDAAFKEEITKALDKGFTEEELKKTIPSWLQQRKTSLGMDASLCELIHRYLDLNKDLSEYNKLEEEVQALHINQVNNALKKYINLQNLTIIYAGDIKN